ncbi:MAG: hypothetical protein ACTSWX_00520 [Promethearchaeota archaeon]
MKNSTYAAVLKKVEPPKINDSYQLGFKTPSGKRILVVLGIGAMGWSGNLSKSKIYYHHSSGKRLIKTSMKNPEHFIGEKFKITGYLQVINENEKKYRLSPVKRIVFYPD